MIEKLLKSKITTKNNKNIGFPLHFYHLVTDGLSSKNNDLSLKYKIYYSDHYKTERHLQHKNYKSTI